MGGPRREIERACDRDERRAGPSDRARDKEDREPATAAARVRAKRARETNDETVREDAAAGRARERKNGGAESPLLSGV